jgi:hypothetical protein
MSVGVMAFPGGAGNSDGAIGILPMERDMASELRCYEISYDQRK